MQLTSPRLHPAGFLALALALPAFAAEPAPAITPDEITEHVRYLADDALEGRGTGSPGERLAGDYLAERLAGYGLEPAGEDGTFFQAFEVAGRPTVEEGAALTIRFGQWERAFARGADWQLLGSSGSFAGSAPLVFAGYGVTDPERGYDDYAGLDVKGKAVLVLRHEPREEDGIGRHSTFVVKAANAEAHGAVALLVVTDPRHHAKDEGLVPFGGGEEGAGILVAHVRQGLIEAMFRLQGRSLLETQEAIDRELKPRSFALDATLEAKADVKREVVTARNVIARLPGSDPALAHEVVVIGAHYDHVGRGHDGGSLARAVGEIHNGADDNASGTAGLLELAQRFAPERPRRTLLFIGFSGEERGLLGSAHFVEHPTVPRESIVAMLNLDMIGRLGAKPLEVGGVGTSPAFEALVEEVCRAEGLKVQLDPSGYGPSDHASFYAAEIPVLFFFTGLHEDYHRPSDDVERLDAAGAARVARVAAACARAIADGERPAYVAVRRERAPRVRVGIRPAQGEDVKGVKVQDALPGGPAAKAGITAGDVIVKIGDTDVDGLRSLLRALGARKPGEKVDVVVQRGDERVTLTLELVGR